MADLRFSDESDAIVDVCAHMADSLIAPAAVGAEQEGRVPADVWTALHELGLTLAVGEEYGGGGIPDPIDQLLAIERLAMGDPGIAAAAVWHGHAALLVGACGTDEQRSSLLPALVAEPERRAGCAMHEGFGRAPSSYDTSISVDGHSVTVVGCKVAVPFASEADPLVVVGRDATDHRLQAVVLDHTRGLAAGNDSGWLALGAARMGTVTFDSTVGSDQLLGGPAANADRLSRNLSRARLSLVALHLGAAQRACNYAAEYAADRIAFGKPIAALQGVSFLLAEARMRIDAVRLESWDVASRLDVAQPDELELAVTAAVNYAGAVSAEVTRDSIQVLGGHGFIVDHPVERWYRSAAALSTIDFDPTGAPFAVAL